MTKQEAAKLILLISSNYRNFPEKGKEDAMTALWAVTFADMPYKLVESAAVKYMFTNKFPPAISDILEQIDSIVSVENLTPIEAWGTFLKAVGNFGYYRKKEALESLDEVTRSIIESMGYEYLCQSSDIMADRAHFYKAYEAKVKRKKQEQQIPKMIAQQIESVRQVMIE